MNGPNNTTYRPGALGALFDEYEKALKELQSVLAGITKDQYQQVVDTETTDEDCRSIATITRHVVSSGFSYANYIRTALNLRTGQFSYDAIPFGDAKAELDRMFAFSLETFDGLWDAMTPDLMFYSMIRTRWGAVYDLEGIMEHAIVHLLRHRRQIQRFIAVQSAGG